MFYLWLQRYFFRFQSENLKKLLDSKPADSIYQRKKPLFNLPAYFLILTFYSKPRFKI
jgi:hypothetical protein